MHNTRPRLRLFVAGSGLLVPLLLIGLFAGFNTKAMAQLLSITVCNSSSPCAGGNNKGTGPGVAGTSAKGYGVNAATTSGPAAVFGSSPSTSYFNSAIFGQATQNAYGVEGSAVNNSGVYGLSTNGDGADGISTNGTGVYGQSSYIGVYASIETGHSAIYALGGNNLGMDINSDGASAIQATTGCSGGCINGNAVITATAGGSGDAYDGTSNGGHAAATLTNKNGNGADIAGTYIGVLGRAPAGGGQFPLVLTDSVGNDLFFVNGNGDVFYHGSLNGFAKTHDGGVAMAYTSKTTSPSVEDTGTAQLVGGSARVVLDPAFAQTIDGRRPYQVFLTPGGDTRGLYVTMKSPTSFVVREVGGGRGSFSFDYHVYAPEFGHANERMLVMSHGAAASMSPKAPLATYHAAQHQVLAPHRHH